MCVVFFHVCFISLHSLLQVYNLVQTLVETQLFQSYKKVATSYHIVNLNVTQKPNEPVYTQNPFLETCLETKCTLLPPLPNSIVLAHIFIHLPLTLLMLWRFRQINKPWFLIVDESVL
jgi:multisubunit Na+/H+ antiporter MnhC subunit